MVAQEFALGFCWNQTFVQGFTFLITIKIIVVVFGLPLKREEYFPNNSKKVVDLKPVWKQFLARGESIEMVHGKGTQLSFLPGHWKDVAKFII